MRRGWRTARRRSGRHTLFAAIGLGLLAGAGIGLADHLGISLPEIGSPEIAFPEIAISELPIAELEAADEVSGSATVRDGDTIVVSGVPVRLNGLHCPERSDPGGAAATAALRRLVAGQRVTCTLTGVQTYDREVGRCRVDGQDLAATLIRQGVCARCPRYDPLGDYTPAQRAAGRWQRSMPGYCL